jgi:hypothetical protein
MNTWHKVEVEKMASWTGKRRPSALPVLLQASDDLPYKLFIDEIATCTFQTITQHIPSVIQGGRCPL